MGASDLFIAYSEYQSRREELIDILYNSIGEWAIDNFSFDAYDSSLELLEIPNDWAPIRSQLEALKDYGFSVLFINYQDATGRLYYKLPDERVWSRCTGLRKQNDIS